MTADDNLVKEFVITPSSYIEHRPKAALITTIIVLSLVGLICLSIYAPVIFALLCAIGVVIATTWGIYKGVLLWLEEW